MTVSEMHLAIRLNLDKSTALVGSVDFLPEELDFWLNEAQDRFIKQRMFGNNTKHEAFDKSVKRIEDLKNLVCSKRSLALATNLDIGVNVKSTDLPVSDSTDPYAYYINSSVANSSGVYLQINDIISWSNISEYIKDSINNPWIKRPLVLFNKNSYTTTPQISVVYGDEFVPNTIDITYIKKPKVLTSFSMSGYQTNTSELSEHTHREIVNIAASMLIENIESPRVQTFDQVNASKVE